ncbi:MAG: flagellar basal body L-ring protein FlgH [Planctomycetaceae bacterium]
MNALHEPALHTRTSDRTLAVSRIGWVFRDTVIGGSLAASIIAAGPLALAQPPGSAPPPIPEPAVARPLMPGPAPVLDFYRQAEGPIGPRIADHSWIFIPAPEPYEIKVHDIVTIIVDEKSETILNSRYNRQRNGTLKAELKEFVRLGSDGNARPAALDQPTIDTNLQSRLQSMGQATDQEGMRFRIAATVVDILPNGNLVLEARRSLQTDGDLWQYALTGILRSEDVNRDNTALSENIANLGIVKRQRGKVRDATKRPWGMVMYDFFGPF